MLKEQQKEMSNRIKAGREGLNYTQEEFAELITISLSSYSKIENAFQKPALDTLISISIHLRLSLDYIVFGEEGNIQKIRLDASFLNSILDFTDKDELLRASKLLRRLAKYKSGG